jgi:hypothetical protein
LASRSAMRPSCDPFDSDAKTCAASTRTLSGCCDAMQSTNLYASIVKIFGIQEILHTVGEIFYPAQAVVYSTDFR